ncbi:hypothetical protein B0H13DRAFT_1913219 [Mycena leptocephala]|nr:hypothetical protein B0H13DRAFT_1913219 [Mycena leptocephala]
MTQDTSDEYADEEFLNLLAALDLAGPDSDLNLPTASLRQTPPQAPPSYTTRPTFRPQPVIPESPGTSSIYYYESPTRHGYTPEWYPLSSGRSPPPATRLKESLVDMSMSFSGGAKKKQEKEDPLMAFPLTQLHVDLLLRAETEHLVKNVPNNIFRGYNMHKRAPGRALPMQPLFPPYPRTSRAVGHQRRPPEPLNGSETLDDYWFVVYKGICPGVYRSHLECQLNTLGVSGAVHESVKGKTAALRKYTVAVQQGDVGVVAPTYYPFL